MIIKYGENLEKILLNKKKKEKLSQERVIITWELESDETQVSHGSGSAWITCGKISSKKNKWDKERKSSLKSFCFIPAADQIQKCFCSVMQILRSWDDWQKAEMRNKRAGNWDMRVLRLHYTATSQTGSNSDGSSRNNRHRNINCPLFALYTIFSTCLFFT